MILSYSIPPLAGDCCCLAQKVRMLRPHLHQKKYGRKGRASERDRFALQAAQGRSLGRLEVRSISREFQHVRCDVATCQTSLRWESPLCNLCTNTIWLQRPWGFGVLTLWVGCWSARRQVRNYFFQHVDGVTSDK